jgi:hypothetical protein
MLPAGLLVFTFPARAQGDLCANAPNLKPTTYQLSSVDRQCRSSGRFRQACQETHRKILEWAENYENRVKEACGLITRDLGTISKDTNQRSALEQNARIYRQAFSYVDLLVKDSERLINEEIPGQVEKNLRAMESLSQKAPLSAAPAPQRAEAVRKAKTLFQRGSALAHFQRGGRITQSDKGNISSTQSELRGPSQGSF